MWKRSFVATTVALGGGVDDALAALSGEAGAPELGASASDLVAELRAPNRATRAAALARGICEIGSRLDEVTLR